MSENSKIEWTDHTFNPWRGCTKVAAGCTNCYAETLSKRNPKVLGIWGDQGTRVVASEAMWRKPLKWAEDWREAYEDWASLKVGGHFDAPRPPRVFCASLADVFEDRPELVGPRLRLLALIEQTPELDWQLLTKRPENVRRLLREGYGAAWNEIRDPQLPKNVWLGTSVACQEDADRNIPELLKVPAAVRFVSYEPAVGPVDFTSFMRPAGPPMFQPGAVFCRDVPDNGCASPSRTHYVGEYGCRWGKNPTPGSRGTLDWLIVGGESGGKDKVRPCDVSWIRSAVEQCKAADVPVFVKQLGSKPMCGIPECNCLSKSKGKNGDPSVWAPDLRVREFPKEGGAS